jgi:hypothetical protein
MKSQPIKLSHMGGRKHGRENGRREAVSIYTLHSSNAICALFIYYKIN